MYRMSNVNTSSTVGYLPSDIQHPTPLTYYFYE